jgi:hypothetical protein
MSIRFLSIFCNDKIKLKILYEKKKSTCVVIKDSDNSANIWSNLDNKFWSSVGDNPKFKNIGARTSPS